MTNAEASDKRLTELTTMGKEVWRRLRDPRVPTWHKAIPLLGLVYLFSPVDLIPDSIPILTQLDDLAILLLALRLFLSLAPKPGEPAVDAAAGTVQEPLDAAFRVRDE